MVRIPLSVSAAAVLALVASPALAQSVGKCSYNSIAQQWPNPTIVHFDTGRTVIHADDAKKIAEVARLAKDHYIQQICVSGFADKQGDVNGNMKLSLARGRAVAGLLQKNGADPRTIMINPNGEPGGSFGGGSASLANQADRRVEIRFTK